ncbi:hypothetical protein BDV24DRAFT_160714 [Aspergillus arachidicola]|uniref:Uncharacterized protein n=1 Tax=Aspergillus arachidicola TaxID=656916 RepID=A0A5N6YFB7_9EURO|nr:hypothetical protein BDV24DRAFT_160714 [Aspergillus arachidicola]
MNVAAEWPIGTGAWPNWATWPLAPVPLAVRDCRTIMRSFNRGLCAVGDLTLAHGPGVGAK